ncbi:uncharacterized protein LOC141692453 isoform X2 [Apium graveolens]|uniref:uncharacterized protein LOC141692453 isoform X2 n=1 Tax=Apium graveolens TaxID=4045 RepID=UPI003D79FAE5
MAFYKFDSLELLNDSKEEWRIRVRAQTLWKGINRQTGEIRGYNVIFCDDYGSKIHAFIAVNLVPKFEPILKEGEIYIVEMFNVKTYNGDETNRPIRNEKHIYFLNEMEMQKDVIPGLQIPAFSFDFYDLEECDCLKDDNHFLTDMIGVIEDVHPRANYNKDGEDKSHVALTITNGSDATGCVPIVWPDDEVTRILGRIVYEVDADHTEVKGLKVIPDILRTLEKKKYNITIDLTDKNLKEGSKVFYVTYISEPVEITDNHSPSHKQPVQLQQTELTNIST